MLCLFIPPSYSQPLTTKWFLYCLHSFAVPECHSVGIIQYAAFSIGFLHLVIGICFLYYLSFFLSSFLPPFLFSFFLPFLFFLSFFSFSFFLSLSFFKFFIQLLNVTFHLQLLQTIGSIPHVMCYTIHPWAYLTRNSVCLPLPHPYIAPPLSSTGNQCLFSTSASRLHFCYTHYVVLFFRFHR